MFRKEDGTIDMAAVLGTVMIACALYILGYTAYIASPMYELLLTQWSFGDMSSVFLLMFCGIAVLAAKGMEYSSRVAIASLAIGLTFMLRNIEFTEFYGEYISFVVSVVSFILGIVAVTASMALLFKYRFYSSRVLMAVAVMILVECVPVYMYYHSMYSWNLIFYICGASFGYIAVDAMLVIALRAEDIRVPSAYEKIERSMEPVRTSSTPMRTRTSPRRTPPAWKGWSSPAREGGDPAPQQEEQQGAVRRGPRRAGAQSDRRDGGRAELRRGLLDGHLLRRLGERLHQGLWQERRVHPHTGASGAGEARHKEEDPVHLGPEEGPRGRGKGLSTHAAHSRSQSITFTTSIPSYDPSPKRSSVRTVLR